mgnify:FL=1
MDKLKAMQVFVRIADTGSLTAAARSMDSSLPAVVRSLATLEAYLQVRLFNRTTRRIALTEEGKQYLGNCRQLLSAVEDAENALTVQNTEPSGLLTVTAPVLFGQLYVASAVTRFMQRYDKLRCNVILLDRVVNLIEDGIDVGVRIGPLDDSSLIAQPLGSTRRVIVASPEFLELHTIPKHPMDLQDANCIISPNSTNQLWSFQENGKQLNVSVSGNLEFNQVAPAVEACAAGLGIGMFMSYQVEPFLQKNRLIVLLEKFELPPRPINVVYPHVRFLPTRTRLFIQWMKEELKGLKTESVGIS